MDAKLKVIFFDVNETLLDLESMRESVAEALGGRDDLLPLWFSKMLHHSLVDSATERYHGFGEIGVAALLMVAGENGIALDEAEAKKAIAEPLLSLPPHPDVKDGLRSLRDSGVQMVSLTNSSNAGVRKQFENAGLTEYFDRRLSVEDIKVYKPNLETYRWAMEQLGVEPGECLMVAAHGWDVAGAKAAGMRTAFVAREGKSLYPLGLAPDYVIRGIDELVPIVHELQ